MATEPDKDLIEVCEEEINKRLTKIEEYQKKVTKVLEASARAERIRKYLEAQLDLESMGIERLELIIQIERLRRKRKVDHREQKT